MMRCTFFDGKVPRGGDRTITVSESARGFSDLGVIYARTCLPMLAIENGEPNRGQYRTDGPTYVFSKQDAGRRIRIYFGYNEVVEVTSNSQADHSQAVDRQ